MRSFGTGFNGLVGNNVTSIGYTPSVFSGFGLGTGTGTTTGLGITTGLGSTTGVGTGIGGLGGTGGSRNRCSVVASGS